MLGKAFYKRGKIYPLNVDSIRQCGTVTPEDLLLFGKHSCQILVEKSEPQFSEVARCHTGIHQLNLSFHFET